jgi:hypothetical protein
MRGVLRSLALSSLRAAPTTPTPRHPPELRLRLDGLLALPNLDPTTGPRGIRAANLRQTHVRRQRRRLGRLEQLRSELDGQEHESSKRHSCGCL